jgi:choline kinase
MPVPVTVVISCAGRGTRLGLGTTKALVELQGRPMIAWQLDLLSAVKDIRVVVGHDARRVIELVSQIRPDALFVFNRDYTTTGTAASVALAITGTAQNGDVLSLDGDLLVAPADLQRFLSEAKPRLGVFAPCSSEPVYTTVDTTTSQALGFTRSMPADGTVFEWSGLFRINTAAIAQAISLGVHRKHVFEMLTPHLPLPYEVIDAVEVDTPEDFRRAETWISTRQSNWKAQP